MTGEAGAHSFDHPRVRAAPSEAEVHTLAGSAVTVRFDRPTLVVAVKPACDGCAEFVVGELAELRGVRVVVVTASPEGDAEWAASARPVLVAPQLLAALDVRSAPFYVLVLPEGPTIVAEGSVFSPAQVAGEIAPHLA